MRRKNRILNNIIILFSLIVLFSFCVGYSALRYRLTITGNTDIDKNTWDIHFENININPGSVEATTVPTINDDLTLNFGFTLSIPGDYYEFTVDVVNDGTLNGMVESLTRTLELTSEQDEFLNYIITYQNNEQIESRDLIEKGSFVRIKVRVEFELDLDSNFLPETEQALNLGFILNLVQSDKYGEKVPDNGLWKAKANGDINTVGTIVMIGTEQFYVIGTEGENVKLLSMYNLLVGKRYDGSNKTPILFPTEIQDSTAIGCYANNATPENPHIGVLSFSNNPYWDYLDYVTYVYNNNSNLYIHIENYKNYLINKFSAQVNEIRPIKYEELESLGCSGANLTCSGAPNWVYSTGYWTGSTTGYNGWYVERSGNFKRGGYDMDWLFGIRPVVVVPKTMFN